MLLVFSALFWQLFQLYRQNKNFEDNLSKISQKAQVLTKENANLMADAEYFSNPENLAKEIRSRFNYKKPGEKLIIGVSPREATTSNQ